MGSKSRVVDGGGGGEERVTLGGFLRISRRMKCARAIAWWWERQGCTLWLMTGQALGSLLLQGYGRDAALA